MNTALMSIKVKKLMKIGNIVFVLINTCVLVFVLYMWCVGAFHDVATGVIVSSSLISIFVFILSKPGFRYNRIWQSTVCLTDKQIQILDKRGVCWKKGTYDEISNLRVEEIVGFFYGENREKFREKYVCIFFNGLVNVPNVEFKDLFFQKDFMMFAFDAEALSLIRKKVYIPDLCPTTSQKPS